MSSALTALSPLDGRYAAKLRPLQDHFSELALMRERVAVEVAWLLALAEEPTFEPLKPFSPAAVATLVEDLIDLTPDEREARRQQEMERAGSLNRLGMRTV